jgi:4-amino-4-deoxy-L-arabinose transferase-like glycosyltransferase
VTATFDRLVEGARARLTYGRSIALITAAGAALRILLAARQQIGYDEDFTAVTVGQPLGRMLDIVSRDSAPPLFYVLEKLAAQIGNAPWNLRLVPLAAGIALIPLLAALGRRIRGDAAGLWTAAFVAALPAALQSSTHARMYGLAGTLMVAATLLLWRAAERPTVRRWVALAAVGASAVWTNYFAAVALAGLLLAALWLRPSHRAYASACLSLAVAVASIAPWLLYASAQLSHTGQHFWIQPLSPATVAGMFGQLFSGPRVEAGLPYFDALFWLQVAASTAGWLALAALLVAWRRGLTPTARRAAIFCLLACSGVLILLAASLWRSLLEARYASVMWLPLFALAGTSLAVLPRRAAGLLVAVLFASSLSLSLSLTHPGTAELLPEVEARLGEHDLVAADSNHYLKVLAQASPTVDARLHVLATSNPPWYMGLAAYPDGAVMSAVPADVVDNGGLIFYMADTNFVPKLLPSGYVERERRCLAETCLTIYGPGG